MSKAKAGLPARIAVIVGISLFLILLYASWGASAHDEEDALRQHPGRAQATVTAIEKLNDALLYTVTYTDQHGVRHEAGASVKGALTIGDQFEAYYPLNDPDDTSEIADVRLGLPGSLARPNDSMMIGAMIVVGIVGAGAIALTVYQARCLGDGFPYIGVRVACSSLRRSRAPHVAGVLVDQGGPRSSSWPSRPSVRECLTETVQNCRGKCLFLAPKRVVRQRPRAEGTGTS